jgi:hypothetical protein
LPKTPEQLRAKNERDAAMLAQDLADDPGNVHARFYLAAALTGIGKADEAIDHYAIVAQSDGGEYGTTACYRAAALLSEQGRQREAIEACAQRLAADAGTAELPYVAAVASLRAGNWEQARCWARLAEVHGEHGDPGALARRVSFRAPGALRDGPAQVLAVALRELGNTAGAIEAEARSFRCAADIRIEPGRGTAPHITVTSSAINAARWAPRCIGSVESQTICASHVYVAADHETLYAADRASRHGARGGIGRGLLANLLPIWRSLPDDEVIVWLDGDDWLATDRALETVAAMHAAGAWATYGQFIWSDGRVGFAAPVRVEPRAAPWTATHLKTFRAGLVKRIRDEDLQQPDGAWVDVAIDQAIMLPILEMAGERARFCPRVLCVYNDGHSFGANADAASIAREAAEVSRIRSRPRYPQIDASSEFCLTVPRLT